MISRSIIVALLIMSILGCTNNEHSNKTSNPQLPQITQYDPTAIAVNDVIGTMTVSEVSISDSVEQPVIDIRFHSEAIEIDGTFENLKASDFDTDVLLFIPDETSSHYFPMHNLFEHQIRLYITDMDKVELFEGKINGTARIRIKNFYDYVHYKDEIHENTNLIDVLELR